MDNDNIRILWLTSFLPIPRFGAGTRVFHLMKAVAGTCDIDLIASDRAVHLADALRPICRTVTVLQPPASSRRRKRLLQLRSVFSRHPGQFWTVYSQQMQECIDRACRDNAYDVVILESSLMGYYTFPDGTLLVLDQHNVESGILRRAVWRERSLARRAFNLLEFVKFQSDEKRICRKAHLILATSIHDCQTMQRWKNSADVVVIPNGVDTTSFTPPADGIDNELIGNVVFTGSMHYSPNTEAMLYFIADIWPLVQQQAPHATLRIVGGYPPREIVQLAELPNVTVEGSVADIRPYLASAQVVVAPLRIGGGTRLKILEAMATGRAIVSTALGCEGLEVRDGQHLLVADEPAEFAARVTELLNDASRRAALGQQGRELVEQQYDWRAIGSRLETVLRDLVKRRALDVHPMPDRDSPASMLG